MQRISAKLLIGSLGLVCLSSVAASPGPAGPAGPDASSASSTGAIAYTFGEPGQDHHIYTIGADGAGRRQVLPTPQDWSAWSPDGTHLLVPYELSDGRLTAATVGSDGSDLTSLPLPDDGSLNLGPAAWSPDGARLALEGWGVTDGSLNGLYTATTSGTDLTRLTTVDSPGEHDIALSYSPDGRWIMFARLPEDGERGPLFVVSVDGSTPRRLSTEGQVVWLSGFGPSATWSPDSSHIAFTAFDSDTGSRSASFLVGVDGTDPAMIADWGSYNTGARFSPDGQWVLYDRGLNDGHHHQFLVRPDGTGTTQITNEATIGEGDCCGMWSPDGRSIVFQAGPDSAAQLYTMAADGTGAHQLTHEAGEYGLYSWSPVTGSAP